MQPLTDDELAEFLALDDKRTAGEWSTKCGDLGVYMVEIPNGHSLGYDFEGACEQCIGNIDFIAGCSRVARRMAEELLRRRHDERHLTHDVAEFYPDDAPDDMDEYHRYRQDRIVGG